MKTWHKAALGLTLAAVLIGGGTAVSFKIRGLRNNNPGNIRLTNIEWQGKVPNNLNTDGEFEQFYDVSDGIRAMARDLLTDYNRGTDTIAKMISVYAPSNENNTEAYIASVSKQTGVDRNAKYPSDKVVELVSAIIKHENGINPYKTSTIEKAVISAGWRA